MCTLAYYEYGVVLLKPVAVPHLVVVGVSNREKGVLAQPRLSNPLRGKYIRSRGNQQLGKDLGAPPTALNQEGKERKMDIGRRR